MSNVTWIRWETVPQNRSRIIYNYIDGTRFFIELPRQQNKYMTSSSIIITSYHVTANIEYITVKNKTNKLIIILLIQSAIPLLLPYSSLSSCEMLTRSFTWQFSWVLIIVRYNKTGLPDGVCDAVQSASLPAAPPTALPPSSLYSY